MEISQVRRRLTAAIEQARRAGQERRERSQVAQRAYETFLNDVAVPVARMVANALKADGYSFTVATPAGGVRLISDKGRDDYIDVGLDTTTDPPEVVGRTSYTRGSRTVSEEQQVKAGTPPHAITDEDLLEFFVRALAPWLER